MLIADIPIYIRETLHYIDREIRYLFKFNKNIIPPATTTSSKEWNKLAKNIRKELIVYGFKDFKKGYIGRHIATREPYSALEHSAVWQFYNTIRRIDILDLLNGNREWEYIQAVDEFYNINNEFDLPAKAKICEIGGGYGRLAQIFLKAMPHVEYTIVDIEPMVTLAKHYLKGHKNIEIVTEIPNKKFDLFINIDSFQEMTPEIIMDYFDKILSKMPKYIYLKNSDRKEHNLVDNDKFNLIEYPKKIGLDIIEQRRSIPYEDMVEQFICYA